MVTATLLFKIDRGSPLSIKKQIIDAIRSYIDRGVIKSETALPSTRDLAERLAVSRYTVCQAYEELQILGYLKSRQGSYNIVQKRRREAEYNPKRPSLIDWAKISNRFSGIFGVTLRISRPARTSPTRPWSIYPSFSSIRISSPRRLSGSA
jgi:DNA-binding transcriptional regulator YhcF (GntR family)